MSQNLVAMIWYVVGTIIIVGGFCLFGIIMARRKEAKEFELERIKWQKIRVIEEAMYLAAQQNLQEAGLILSKVDLYFAESVFNLPEIFWEANIKYMARTLTTCVKLYILRYGLEDKGLHDTVAVFIYGCLAERIKKLAETDPNKSLSLVAELAARDKRAVKGMTLCFLGNDADEIYR